MNAEKEKPAGVEGTKESQDDDLLTPLAEEDWNFEAVSDGEIIACCLWEYARESSSIGLAAEIHWCHTRDFWSRGKYERDPGVKAEDDETAARIQRRAKERKFDYEAFREKFWDTDLALVEIYQSLAHYVHDGAGPWAQLVEPLRSRLTTQVTESNVLCPVAPAFLGELEKLWNENRMELDEVRSRARPEYDDSEDDALWAHSQPVALPEDDSTRQSGKLAVALTVDFARFTDREMCAEFERWLSVSRPAQWKQPRRVFPGAKHKGRKLLEYRVALERLGLMRLLHWHTPAELRRELPQAWVKVGRKQADFRRELREASKFFRACFPFLPKKEKPHSETRKGVWWAQMEKACERADRKFGLSRGQ